MPGCMTIRESPPRSGALKRDGVLAVWSAREDRKFEKRLRHGGFAVQVERVRGRSKNGGPHHTIFVGRKS